MYDFMILHLLQLSNNRESIMHFIFFPYSNMLILKYIFAVHLTEIFLKDNCLELKPTNVK